MTTITTREALTTLVDTMYDESAANDFGIAHTTVGALAGTGTPADQAFADSIGSDYICALADGTIAAWGAEIARDGYTDRELVFIAPAQQAA